MFVLTRGRIIHLAGVVLSFLILGTWLGVDYYYRHTQLVAAYGGEYVEGVVGQPVNLNPLVAITDVDNEINKLVFSGLTRIDSNGKLAGDLAREWEINPDGLVYTFHLRQDVVWHDGAAFTAEDVVFTIALIQDANYPGPFIIRNNWLGVQVEKLDDHTVRFTLPDPYAPFIESTSIGIVPAHLLNAVASTDLLTTEFNRAPVGTGPYRYDHANIVAEEVESIVLTANNQHYAKPPYIERFSFRFYPNAQEAVEALKNRSVQGIRDIPMERLGEINNLPGVEVHTAALPNYQAVYFNTKDSVILQDLAVRRALSLAVDKSQLVQEVLGGAGQTVDGPLLPDSWAYVPSEEGTVNYDLDRARTLLEEAGWVDTDGDGVRQKDDRLLTFDLISDDDEQRREAAFLLAEMWKQVGVQTNVKLFGVGTFIEDYLRRRAFDAVLFGQNVGWDPDLYAFWHSSQINDPGMNVSRLENTKLDKALEDGRRLTSLRRRQTEYAEVQKLIRENVPAIFLYAPEYYFAVNRQVQGVSLGFMTTVTDRFKTLPNWYVQTKRVRSLPEDENSDPVEDILENEDI